MKLSLPQQPIFTNLDGVALNRTPTLLQSTVDYRYHVFVVFWSIAALFHLAHSRIFADGFHYALLTTAAILVLVKPSSIIRLLLFLSVQLMAGLRTMPYVPNHEIFVLLADLTILHALLYCVYKNRSFKINKTDFFGVFSSLLKIELLLLYFFVVFHKLNSSFFNVGVSCATGFYDALNAYSLLPATKLARLLCAYFTVLVEALIPILLFFRKSRNTGLLIGLIFHGLIAYNHINGFYDFTSNGFYDFSSVIFACYVVFMSNGFCSYLNSCYNKLMRYIKSLKSRRYSEKNLVGISIATLLFVLIGYIVSKNIDDYFRYIVWTLFSFTLIGLFIKYLLSFKEELSVNFKNHFYRPPFSLLLFPCIVFINGVCPYLGLKTESSFAMFSNLRTEGGVSNHFLVPAGGQIFDFQKDLVEIRSSSSPALQLLAERKQLLPYFQFKEEIRISKPRNVQYIWRNKYYNFSRENLSGNEEILKDNPFLLRKLLRFRPVKKHEPQVCDH